MTKGRSSLRSTKELVAKIEDFVAHYNEHARPFIGTLAQYPARLHRLHAAKKELIIDSADLQVPMLAKKYDRRRTGQKAIGYELDQDRH
jgi:hypothetical protein